MIDIKTRNAHRLSPNVFSIDIGFECIIIFILHKRFTTLFLHCAHIQTFSLAHKNDNFSRNYDFYSFVLFYFFVGSVFIQNAWWNCLDIGRIRIHEHVWWMKLVSCCCCCRSFCLTVIMKKEKIVKCRMEMPHWQSQLLRLIFHLTPCMQRTQTTCSTRHVIACVNVSNRMIFMWCTISEWLAQFCGR